MKVLWEFSIHHELDYEDYESLGIPRSKSKAIRKIQHPHNHEVERIDDPYSVLRNEIQLNINIGYMGLDIDVLKSPWSSCRVNSKNLMIHPKMIHNISICYLLKYVHTLEKDVSPVEFLSARITTLFWWVHQVNLMSQEVKLAEENALQSQELASEVGLKQPRHDTLMCPWIKET